jgi:hypothetical protein
LTQTVKPGIFHGSFKKSTHYGQRMQHHRRAAFEGSRHPSARHGKEKRGCWPPRNCQHTASLPAQHQDKTDLGTGAQSLHNRKTKFASLEDNREKRRIPDIEECRPGINHFSDYL